MRPTPFQEFPQEAARAQKMILPDDLVHEPGPHALGQRRIGAMRRVRGRRMTATGLTEKIGFFTHASEN